MAFSNNYLLFVLMGKGIFEWQQWYFIGNSGTGDPSMLHHETIFGKEIHTLIAFMVNVMASNTVDGL